MTLMSECIFCQIIRKKAPASIVYEDEQVTAFLSNRPVNVGHTLVAPKMHYENIYEIPEEEAAYLFKIVKKIAHAVKDTTGIQGIRIVQNNGVDAGQVVFHLHVHIIPMKPQASFFMNMASEPLNCWMKMLKKYSSTSNKVIFFFLSILHLFDSFRPFLLAKNYLSSPIFNLAIIINKSDFQVF